VLLVASMTLGSGRLSTCIYTRQAANDTADRVAADASVSHYWEEEGWPVSSRLRTVLGIGPYDPTQSAWDIHLSYRRGVTWDGDTPPTPTAWAYNQLVDLDVGERLSTTVVQRWVREVIPRSVMES
jgi:hypothetical protein